MIPPKPADDGDIWLNPADQQTYVWIESRGSWVRPSDLASFKPTVSLVKPAPLYEPPTEWWFDESYYPGPYTDYKQLKAPPRSSATGATWATYIPMPGEISFDTTLVEWTEPNGTVMEGKITGRSTTMGGMPEFTISDIRKSSE